MTPSSADSSWLSSPLDSDSSDADSCFCDVLGSRSFTSLEVVLHFLRLSFFAFRYLFFALVLD